MVERRIAYGRVEIRSAPELAGVRPQVDANVRSAGRVDDVHELEREMTRLRGEDDSTEDIRERFDDQPGITV